MTREKAIDVLKSECYVFNPLNFDRTTLINTALDVAIESLKQPKIDKVDIEKITTIVGEFMREYAFKDDMTVNVDGEDYDLFDVLASIHNELYKTQKGEYYDYMWHWANKCLADCNDGLFKGKVLTDDRPGGKNV